MFNQVKRLLGIETNQSSAKSTLSIDWVLPGKLGVGRLPKAGEGEVLVKGKIKTVLSLCAETEGALPEDITSNFQCFRVVLPDRFYYTEMKPEDLGDAVTIVRSNLINDQPVYVHCLAGVERSPTVCIAYLCRYENMELWEATNWVKQVHPDSFPSISCLRAIREYLNQN